MSQERVGQTLRAYVTHERVESSKGCPARAKSLGGVLGEATDVRSNHRHLVHAGETEDTGDRVGVMYPCAEVVS